MSKPLPERSLVVRWDGDAQAFKICSVDTVKVQAVADQAFNIDLPVEAFGGEGTNDIASQIGIAMVNQLAMYNPDLKALNKTTEQPAPPADGSKKPFWKR